MDPFGLAPLGKSGLKVPRLGFGGAPLGDPFGQVSDEQADATMAAAWAAGVRYYDTSPWYGRTQSEHRIGRFLRRQPREEVLLSTKVGRIFCPPADPSLHADERRRVGRPGELNFDYHHDYTYDGVMRSYEDSLQRLGMPRVDVLVIHDLDLWHLKTEERVSAHVAQLVTGGFRALRDLKAWGCIKAIGAGVNELGTIPRFVALLDLDFFLVALRYTLGEQSALATEFPLLEERGIGVVVGGVFNSGLYAAGPVPGARFNYREPTPAERDKALRIGEACRRHGVPLTAAALQFPLHHPAVASVIPGATKPEEVESNAAAVRHSIPPVLWAELKHEGLIAPEAPTP